MVQAYRLLAAEMYDLVSLVSSCWLPVKRLAGVGLPHALGCDGSGKGRGRQDEGEEEEQQHERRRSSCSQSAIGIGSLLQDGLGDTIRVSLTEDPW